MKTRKEIIDGIGQILVNEHRPMKERFRALFTLRNLGGERCIEWIEKGFSSPSALLKHECAYCLGQMQDPTAIPKLESVLEDTKEEAIVRHEAAEALGAIGSLSSLDILKKYMNDPVREVSETCQLAVERITLSKSKENANFANPYLSVDPAPPFFVNLPVRELEQILLDESQPLFKRYRAMFSLRNMQTTEAVKILAKGLKSGSALFRHEVAFVLGQIQSDACVEELSDVLRDESENEMVRHECAEALGSIAGPNCERILNEFLSDSKRVVRESCEVAVDVCKYENSAEFQYADGLIRAIN